MGSHQSRDSRKSDAQHRTPKNRNGTFRSQGGSLSSSADADASLGSSTASTSHSRSLRFLSPKSVVSPRVKRSPSVVEGFRGDLPSEAVGARMANPQGGGEKASSSRGGGNSRGFGFRAQHNGGGGGGGSSSGLSAKESSRSPNPGRGHARPKSKTRSQLAPPGTNSPVSSSSSSSSSASSQHQTGAFPCASVESLNDNENSPIVDNHPQQVRRFGFRGNNNNSNNSSNNSNNNNNNINNGNNKINNNNNNNNRSTPSSNDASIAVIETPSTTGLVATTSSSAKTKTKSLPTIRGKSRLLGPGAFGRSGASPTLPPDNSAAASAKTANVAAVDNFQYPPGSQSPKLRAKSAVVDATSKTGKSQGGGVGKMKNSGFGFRYDGIKSRLMPPTAASRSSTPPIKSPNEKIRKDLVSKAMAAGDASAAAPTATAKGEVEDANIEKRGPTATPRQMQPQSPANESSRPSSLPASTQSTRRGNHFSVDGLNFIDASSSEDFVSAQSSEAGSPPTLTKMPKSPLKKTAFPFNNNFMEDKVKVEKAVSDVLENEKNDGWKKEKIDEETFPVEETVKPVHTSPIKEEVEAEAREEETAEDDVNDVNFHNIEIVEPDSPIPKTNLNLSLQSYSLEEDVETPLAPAPPPPASNAFSAPVAVMESSFVESVSSRGASPSKKVNIKLDDLLRVESDSIDRTTISIETDDNVDLGKGSSVEEEETFPSFPSPHERHHRHHQPQSSVTSDSDFIESESIDDEVLPSMTTTAKLPRKSSSDADRVSVASRNSNPQELPDVETLSSCSLDSNDLMLDVDHSIDDIDFVGGNRKDSFLPSSQRWSQSSLGGRDTYDSTKLHHPPGDLMTYNEEGGGDGHVLDGLEDIKEELDLLQKSLDLSSCDTASSSPLKKTISTSVTSSSMSKPCNGGLMDSHPSVWSSSKVSLSNKVSDETVERRSASPVLKSRCASVTEIGKTASPKIAGGGVGRPLSAAAAVPRLPIGVSPKLRPPRTLPADAELEGLAFVLDGVTYRRSLQDVISMKTMLLKLKRILQQDEFTSAPFTPTTSPGHLRSGFPWPATPCSNCGNQMLYQVPKTPVSKRHSAHFPVNETPRLREDAASLGQMGFLQQLGLAQPVEVDSLNAENQELRNQMAFLSQKMSEKDRTIALLQQQMVKYSQQQEVEETDDQITQ